MGQGSSAESDPSGAAAPETTVKTCYYELLGVARDATQDEYAALFPLLAEGKLMVLV
jgi:hypothetical protein